MNVSGQYIGKLYAEPAPSRGSSTPRFGVCLSGGGSRALSCALGQLSALNGMIDPATNHSVLSETTYLSSVSGGSWASVLYTFFPATINGRPISDSDFLIQPVAPAGLVKGDPTDHSPGNVLYMGAYSLGNVPQRFNFRTIASFLYTLHRWRFFDNPQRWSWFWIAGIGEIVLKPFELYSAVYDPDVDYPQPAEFFSLSASQVSSSITPNNPTLTASQFHLCRANRPSLIVNTNLIQDYSSPSSAQIPVQATPVATYVRGRSPDQTSIVGGGGVESFAFTSMLDGPGTASGTAAVGIERAYSLSDIAGCSSAFFAAYLLRYLNDGVDDILLELENYLVNEFHIARRLAQEIASAVKAEMKSFLDVEAAKVIPLYNYWPLDQVGQKPPSNARLGFSDGGDFDNTGILGILAQSEVNRIVSFVNSETPLSLNPASKEVIVDTSLPLLFGYRPQPQDGVYESFGGMSPSQPLSFVQVFSDEGGEFAALRRGLYDASCRDSTTPGTATAAFQQALTTLPNSVAGIAGGRKVTVLWVYNNRVDDWQDAITDRGILADLQLGQGPQPAGPLMNFPNYLTGEQICLQQEAVNMLAQLSGWNVQQLKTRILALLR